MGKIIRKVGIDELPQLINIIKGEMTYIGPRPLRERLHNYYMQRLPEFQKRYSILPGITGLAQVMDLEDHRDLGLTCDLFYIKNRTLWLNTLIIVATVVFIIIRCFRSFLTNLRIRIFKGSDTVPQVFIKDRAPL